MKRRQVYWAQDALADLAEAIAWIAADNPRAARSTARKIRSAGGKLGATATGRRGRVAGTYEKVVTGTPYIIAYQISIGRQQVEEISILRVIHGARDWQEEQWPTD